MFPRISQCLLIVSILPLSYNAQRTLGADSSAEFVVKPALVKLVGPDSVQQLAIDFRPDTKSRWVDMTSKAVLKSANPKVATVDASGGVIAVSDGKTQVQVEVQGMTRNIEVHVTGLNQPSSMNFTNQIVPIFTKNACNGGGCHGKSGGQNGFRLSLLGFEPVLDYETLLFESRGRRLFPAKPTESLLLLKAIGESPHGGGKRIEPDSRDYRQIVRWIASGMPFGQPNDPVIKELRIEPGLRVLSRNTQQQLQVTAIYSDGTTEDVTRLAQYQSNDTEVAEVEDSGIVRTKDLAGQAGVMARYQGLVTVFTAKVPLGLPIAERPAFNTDNLIDRLALKHWNSLGLLPSQPCTDGEFIRRVSIDIIGTLPTADESKAFVADKDPLKRSKLVDKLLQRPEYASLFAIKWADILRNKRGSNPYLSYGFYSWIRQQIDQNVPYDSFVRGILAASGTPRTAPPVMWYGQLKSPDAFVDDTAQVFLGMRLQCAKCHHHPFEKWSQDDYYGFAAFFGRVGRKADLEAARRGRREEVIFTAKSGDVRNPNSGQVMVPKGLGASDPMTIPVSDDPREKLVDWMADETNPFFAPAVINRYWAHFFDRGLAEPIDDMRDTNPASNPELLDGLSQWFIQSGYDLKALVRLICTSNTYGLSSEPNKHNKADKQSFARHYPKRMTAEILLDAVSQLTGVPTQFNGFPAGTRAIELPDDAIGSAFLETFGRPQRDTSCECERIGDASLGQSLMLLNSPEVQAKLTAANGRADLLAKDPRPDDQKFEELVWMAYGRNPDPDEIKTAVAFIGSKSPEKRKEAWEDILWALINAKEFQFVD
ncbi:MAG: hypothetical protein RJA81_738 [Planctomycetota bacterium]|jgi:hypothetical protein